MKLMVMLIALTCTQDDADRLRRDHERAMAELKAKQDRERAEMQKHFEQRMAELEHRRRDDRREAPREQGGHELAPVVEKLMQAVMRLQDEVARLRKDVDALKQGRGERREQPAEVPAPREPNRRREPAPVEPPHVERDRGNERRPDPPKPPRPPRHERDDE